MRALSAHDILRIWEIGQDHHPVDRALTMLDMVCPDMSHHDLADIDVARRDMLLLDLRENTFGAKMDCFTKCPRCSEKLELLLTTKEIRASIKPRYENGDGAFELVEGDLKVKFRLPNSKDIAEAVGYDTASARMFIVRRCIVEAKHCGEKLPMNEQDEKIINTIAESMSAYASQADISIDLTCVGCGHQYQTTLDIASFLWSEISSEAKRLLREVHILATAYGWREIDILSMSYARRKSYLQMVR